MSRSFLPQRPSDYRMPVYMNEVPDEALEEAEEMAVRHGQEEVRSGPGGKVVPAAKPAKPAKAPAAAPDKPDDAAE